MTNDRNDCGLALLGRILRGIASTRRKQSAFDLPLGCDTACLTDHEADWAMCTPIEVPWMRFTVCLPWRAMLPVRAIDTFAINERPAGIYTPAGLLSH